MFQNIFSNADDAAKIICGDDPNKAVMVRYLRKREIVYLAVDDGTVGWAATCEESADVVGDLIRACPLHFPYDEPQKALEWVVYTGSGVSGAFKSKTTSLRGAFLRLMPHATGFTSMLGVNFSNGIGPPISSSRSSTVRSRVRLYFTMLLSCSPSSAPDWEAHELSDSADPGRDPDESASDFSRELDRDDGLLIVPPL
eukprot:g748.t1